MRDDKRRYGREQTAISRARVLAKREGEQERGQEGGGTTGQQWSPSHHVGLHQDAQALPRRNTRAMNRSPQMWVPPPLASSSGQTGRSEPQSVLAAAAPAVETPLPARSRQDGHGVPETVHYLTLHQTSDDDGGRSATAASARHVGGRLSRCLVWLSAGVQTPRGHRPPRAQSQSPPSLLAPRGFYRAPRV
jgi:hypothetical protein